MRTPKITKPQILTVDEFKSTLLYPITNKGEIVKQGQGNRPKKAKYLNRRIEVDGKVFDSVKEAGRYQVLKMLQNRGVISCLKCQLRFDLIVNGQKICYYVADFAYYEGPNLIVEDVKSDMTRKLPVYRFKKKLMKAIHGIEIREV